MQLLSLAEHDLINLSGEVCLNNEKPLICCVHAPAGTWRTQDSLTAAKLEASSKFSILLLECEEKPWSRWPVREQLPNQTLSKRFRTLISSHGQSSASKCGFVTRSDCMFTQVKVTSGSFSSNYYHQISHPDWFMKMKSVCFSLLRLESQACFPDCAQPSIYTCVRVYMCLIIELKLCLHDRKRDDMVFFFSKETVHILLCNSLSLHTHTQSNKHVLKHQLPLQAQ